jgi:exopolyphosphatase/guanosine-5'-triphosphate,3'-diphosphate pyrophosphatase
VLLLVAEWSEGTWIPRFETTRVTALGEGTKQTGVLSESAMERTLVALSELFRLAAHHGAESIVAAATMAVRIATNAEDFRQRAAAQGTPVRVLSGTDEAELGFRAVANDPEFARCERLSIIDPGGHSTELVTAIRRDGDWEVRFRQSFAVGALGLRGVGESLDSLSVFRLAGEVDELLPFCYRPGAAGRVVVLGATGTNLVSIREGMTEWDPGRVHGQTLTYEEVGRAVGWLAAMSDAERGTIKGLERGRERTIHLGALILERFLFALRAEECAVSVRGWRYAALDYDFS